MTPMASERCVELYPCEMKTNEADAALLQETKDNTAILSGWNNFATHVFEDSDEEDFVGDAESGEEAMAALYASRSPRHRNSRRDSGVFSPSQAGSRSLLADGDDDLPSSLKGLSVLSPTSAQNGKKRSFSSNQATQDSPPLGHAHGGVLVSTSVSLSFV